MHIFILPNLLQNIFRYDFIGFYYGKCSCTFVLAEQAHESNVYIAVAETLGNVCNDTWSIQLFDNQCTIFPGKFYINIIDADNFNLTASDGLTTHHHFIAIYAGHVNVGRVRMVRDCFFINNIFIFHTKFFCKVKCITNTGIIGGKAKNTAKKSTVSSVSVVGFCKRTINA